MRFYCLINKDYDIFKDKNKMGKSPSNWEVSIRPSNEMPIHSLSTKWRLQDDEDSKVIMLIVDSASSISSGRRSKLLTVASLFGSWPWPVSRTGVVQGGSCPPAVPVRVRYRQPLPTMTAYTARETPLAVGTHATEWHFHISLSLYLSVSLSISLSIYLSIYRPINRSIYRGAEIACC